MPETNGQACPARGPSRLWAPSAPANPASTMYHRRLPASL